MNSATAQAAMPGLAGKSVAATSTTPRLWFWLALLLISLLVGLLQALAREK